MSKAILVIALLAISLSFASVMEFETFLVISGTVLVSAGIIYIFEVTRHEDDVF